MVYQITETYEWYSLRALLKIQFNSIFDLKDSSTMESPVSEFAVFSAYRTNT